MKTILIIHQSSELYGSDRTLWMFLKYFDRIKLRPVVVLPDNGPLKCELENIGIIVHTAPVLKIYRRMFSFKNITKFLSERKQGLAILTDLQRQYNFELVYSNTLAVLLGAIFAKKHRIRHLWHVHEIIVHPKIIATAFPVLLHFTADTIVCNSEATRNNLVGRISSLSSKTYVIYNGVEKPTIVSQKPEQVGHPIVITLVGRISRLKGHLFTLETFTRYPEIFENVHLMFVGSPVLTQENFLNDITDFIQKHRLESKVKILPYTSDLTEVWRHTDIAIVPSTEAESFGLVAVEAMMRKLPVVGANHGGISEIIQDESVGLLFEPENKLQFAACLGRLIGDSELRNSMGANAAEYAARRFSVTKYVNAIQDACAG